MTYSTRTYRVIAIISFTVLSVVQVFLVFNTYELEKERYFFPQKSAINKYYSRLITNDKLFPGGQVIIDSVFNRNIPRLEYYYRSKKDSFYIHSQLVCDSIFTKLRQHQSVGHILNKYKQETGISDSIEYALTIDALELLSESGNYISIYDKKNKYPLIHAAYQSPVGIRIGGNLTTPNLQNRATGLTVSMPYPGTYKLIFSLYVDTHNRLMVIAKKMMPVLLLSLLSLLVNVWLFYVTFKNWLKQKKLSEMKTDFINSITHEFNTPIAAITVANRSLQNDKIIDRKENIYALSEVIQRQAARLQKLVAQVLDLTTLNEVALQKEPYSVSSLLDEILLDYRLNLADKDIKLNLTKDIEADTVVLDPFYFTTMLLNIMDNGIKYNSNNTKEIMVAVFGDKENIKISIQDNGIGMTGETRKNIFKKFYRSNDKDMLEATGLGLGLYYVKQCADAHGWSLQVDSKKGAGTTFIITIPVKKMP
jgi:two-component system, OmpR family, phosphate regulon sensor histidine kinase PhoR